MRLVLLVGHYMGLSDFDLQEAQHNKLCLLCLLDEKSNPEPNPNPGVAPPDCALLFYWPKRVSRKGPALRWACLARQGGNFNSGCSN